VLHCCPRKRTLGRLFSTDRERNLFAVDHLGHLLAVNSGQVAEDGERTIDGCGLLEAQSERLVAADRRHLDDLAIDRQQQYGSEEEREPSYCHCDSNYNDTSPSNKLKATFHLYLLLIPFKVRHKRVYPKHQYSNYQI
jgi:hypothetical protein